VSARRHPVFRSLPIGTQLQVKCATVKIDGTPAPPRGVQPNTIGGPSTRMARFYPTFSNCTMQIAGFPAKFARVYAWCDWAYAVDGFNGVNGWSRQRLAIGLGCANPAQALTLDDGTCTIQVPSQLFITNGANINIIGQNTPVPPAAPTAMFVTTPSTRRSRGTSTRAARRWSTRPRPRRWRGRST